MRRTTARLQLAKIFESNDCAYEEYFQRNGLLGHWFSEGKMGFVQKLEIRAFLLSFKMLSNEIYYCRKIITPLFIVCIYDFLRFYRRISSFDKDTNHKTHLQLLDCVEERAKNLISQPFANELLPMSVG